MEPWGQSAPPPSRQHTPCDWTGSYATGPTNGRWPREASTEAATSRRRVKRELQHLGWELVQEADDVDLGGLGGVTARYGPYRLAVAFDPESGEPTRVVAERSGSGAVYARRWEGLQSLPEPEKVVRRLFRLSRE